MELLLFLFAGLCAIGMLIGMLICFVLVMIQVFRRGHTVLGIACLVLAFLYGTGILIAFAYGWINAGRWHIWNVMLTWTACMMGAMVTYLIVAPTIAGILDGAFVR